MKLRFYMDVFSGWNPSGPHGVWATTLPGVKVEPSRRIAFDVTIPDAALYGVDYVAPEVSTPELVATPATPEK